MKGCRSERGNTGQSEGIQVRMRRSRSEGSSGWGYTGQREGIQVGMNGYRSERGGRVQGEGMRLN